MAGSLSWVSSTRTGEEKVRVVPTSRERRAAVNTEYSMLHCLMDTLAVTAGSSTFISAFSKLDELSCKENAMVEVIIHVKYHQPDLSSFFRSDALHTLTTPPPPKRAEDRVSLGGCGECVAFCWLRAHAQD